MGLYEYGTFRQTMLRYNLKIYENLIDQFPKAELHNHYLKRRAEIIAELNRVQLEEWNYD